MKKLPKIYQNKIEKELHNNKKVYYSQNNEQEIVNEERLEEEKRSALEVIDEVFSLPTYSFNIPLSIYTKDKVYHTSLIAKSRGHIITFDNDMIPIDEITHIEKRQ